MPSQYRAADDRYEQTPYARVGRSGLLLPRISLGLWNNFGHDRPLATQRDIVLHAFDRGVTHFDLANNYGPPPGAAEEQFGRILDADLRPYRDEIVVSTKAGYDMWPGPYGNWGSRKYMLASLDQSLGRLGLDYVDVFYSHRPDPETPIEETVGALVTAVRSGRALYAGISNYSPEQTAAAAEALADEHVPLLIHQPRYSMFDRTPRGRPVRRTAAARHRGDRVLAARRGGCSPTGTSTGPSRSGPVPPRVAGSVPTASTTTT
jgi:L-glyceraldehyde 3-phosphate reductase